MQSGIPVTVGHVNAKFEDFELQFFALPLIGDNLNVHGSHLPEAFLDYATDRNGMLTEWVVEFLVANILHTIDESGAHRIEMNLKLANEE